MRDERVDATLDLGEDSIEVSALHDRVGDLRRATQDLHEQECSWRVDAKRRDMMVTHDKEDGRGVDVLEAIVNMRRSKGANRLRRYSTGR